VKFQANNIQQELRVSFGKPSAEHAGKSIVFFKALMPCSTRWRKALWFPGRFHDRGIHNGSFLYQKPMGSNLTVDPCKEHLIDTQFHAGIPEPAGSP